MIRKVKFTAPSGATAKGKVMDVSGFRKLFKRGRNRGK